MNIVGLKKLKPRTPPIELGVHLTP